MLYRTDDDKTFSEYFEDLNKKSKKYTGTKAFKKDDALRVPDINLYQETSFPELEGREIRRTNFRIDKTIETVDFRMNNEGVKLKSEAAIMMKCMAMPVRTGRDFLFTDNFVLFLIEKGQKTPYYAMRVTDVETLNKTGTQIIKKSSRNSRGLFIILFSHLILLSIVNNSSGDLMKGVQNEKRRR